MDAQSLRRLCGPLLALALPVALLLASGLARADSATGLLRVSAVVAPRASVSIAQPATITVTEADVARGYLELPAPVQVVVRGNMAEGYGLVFERRGDEVGEVQVQGLGQPLVFGSTEALKTRPAPGTGYWREQLSLRFRLALSAATAPGEHAWPVQISLVPL